MKTTDISINKKNNINLLFLFIGILLSYSTDIKGQNSSIDANNALISGADCSAFGDDAYLSGIGNNNSALGYRALYNVTTGDNNTACGARALYNNTGDDNTSVGYNSLFNNGSANENTAVGSQALFNNVSGQYNVAFGNMALYTSPNGSGDYNTCHGSFAGVTNNNDYNQTSVGYLAVCWRSDMIRLGNGAIANFNCNVAITSDSRFKINVKEDEVKGLEFIKRLKPVTYYFDNRKFTEHITSPMQADKRKIYLDQDFSKADAGRRTGFIAQEVELAANEVHYDFDALQKPVQENDVYGLSYAGFVVPLVKAVQEQQQLINKIKDKIEARKVTIKEISENDMGSGNSNSNQEYSIKLNSSDSGGKVTIEYQLKKEDTSVTMECYDFKGTLLKAFALDDKENSIVLDPVTIGDMRYCSLVKGGDIVFFLESQK